jgi:2-methylisocitrate lyase-like PEP mutase family enzyme
MKKTTKLRELFNRDKIFIVAGGGCALHALIAEQAGYECAYMSGAHTAATVFGLPDAGLITMTEMVENARRMAGRVGIPLISDSDQGFGNATNVRRTVTEFIRAGVAGIHIEDQTTPKRCGDVVGKQVISVDEAVGKYRAAVDAKNEIDPDFVVIARCDARGAPGGSLGDAIARMKAYKKAGADVIYFERALSLDELRAARAEVAGPLMATMSGLTQQPRTRDLEELGYACAFHPGLLSHVSMTASWEYAHDFKDRLDRAESEWESRPVRYPMPHILDIVGFPELFEWEQKYLPEAEVDERYATSVGAYDPRTTTQQAMGSGPGTGR